MAALEPFLDEGLIEEVLFPVRSGKEATVYCCRANPKTGQSLVAAKVYRSREQRSFRNDAVYREGRVITNARCRRAVEKKTDFGKEAAAGMWINHEWETLRQLHEAGLDVPAPIRMAEHALLMGFIGDEGGAAPQLVEVVLDRRQARRVADRLIWNVERALAHNQVHGDLSAYNVLYWEEQAWVIDLPQTVDARFNPNARELLERDLRNLCDYFQGSGLSLDSQRIANSFWRRYRLREMELGRPVALPPV